MLRIFFMGLNMVKLVIKICIIFSFFLYIPSPSAEVIEPLNNTVSFVVLSHIYPLLFSGNQSDIDRLINEIKGCSPDILILPGDIIEGTWNSREWKEHTFDSEESLQGFLNNQWDEVLSILDRLDVPIWIAPGNHDISSYTPGYMDIVREVFVSRAGEPFHAKSFKNYGFLFLNTNISDSTGTKYSLDEEQVQWLKDELSSSSHKADFLFLHHPVWYGGLRVHPGNTNMEPFDWMQEVHPILSEKVKFVFAGDGGTRFNFLFYEIRDDIHYYVNGSGRYGVSFLHILAGEAGIKVNPHFLNIISIDLRKLDKNIHKDNAFYRKYPRKALFVLRSKSFWAGMFTSLLLSCVAIFIFRRNATWFRSH